MSDGWLGPDDMPTQGNQYWSRFNVLNALRMYAEANETMGVTIKNVMLTFILQAKEIMNTVPFGFFLLKHAFLFFFFFFLLPFLEPWVFKKTKCGKSQFVGTKITAVHE